ECLAYARRRRGECTQLDGKELAESLRARGGRGVKVGDSTDSAHRVIGAIAIGVDGDDILGRAEGQSGPGRELDGHQPKQGREPGVLAILDLQSLPVVGDIRVDQWLPGRLWDRGLVSRNTLPRLFKVGSSEFGKPDQRLDEGSMLKAPRGILTRDHPLGVEQ